MEGAATDEQFLAGTLELMRRCDAVILVPGWSTSEGTKAEIAEAMRIGLPMFGMEGTVDDALRRLTAWAADDRDYQRGDCWVRGTMQEPDGPDCTDVVVGLSGFTVSVENRDIRRYR